MARIELLAHREVGINGMEIALKPNVPFIITPTLVRKIRILQDKMAQKYFQTPWEGVFYMVWHMEVSNLVHWKGLDYSYIYQLLLTHQGTKVEKYIDDIFDVLFLTYVGLALPILNCSIIDRKTTGLSREFFLLNKICFIHDDSIEDIVPINMNSDQLLVFPKEIYAQNRYFLFKEMDYTKMRALIESIDLPVLDEEALAIKQKIFEDMKKLTLETLFHYANDNKMKILKRLAGMQQCQVQIAC